MADENTPTLEQLQEKLAAAEKRVEAEERAKKTILGEKKAAEARLAALEGIDPEEHQKLKAAAAEAAREKAKALGDWDAREKMIRDEMAAEHEKAVKPLSLKAEKMRSALERRLVDAELTSAIARAKGVPELLLPHVRQHVRVKEVDDDFVAYVADKDGNPRIGDAKGSPMSFDQLVEDMKGSPIFARAFEGTGSSGSGAPSHATGGGAAGTLTLDRNDPGAMGRLTSQQLKDIDAGKLKVVFS